LEIFGIYDSGSNVSLINSKLIKIKNRKPNNINNANLRTINGVEKTSGLITIEIKIFEIEKKVDVFIIDEENFKYDFLIGLDMIKNFKLIQSENLIITQKNDNKIKKDITNNKIKNNQENYTINFNEHIKENDFQMNIDHLTKNQKSEINKLIDKYKSVFAKDKYDIGTVKEYEARIDLLIDKYCSKRPYRCTVENKKEMEEQISK